MNAATRRAIQAMKACDKIEAEFWRKVKEQESREP